MGLRNYANIGCMTRLQVLEYRRAGAYFLGVLFFLLGLYLRCFVFLKLSSGAFFVYGAGLVGGLLIEVGKRSGRAIEAERLRD